jgi:NAD(P)H-dependent FMN reductase
MQVTAIVGSYKKGGIVDNSVDEILAAAKTAGADVTKIYLIDKHIEFCCNCRACMQPEGPKRGDCSLADEMADILDQIERSDAIVLASPMNFGTVTAVMKRFVERLACYGYWPWGAMSPQAKNKQKTKRAVVVASSAAPAFIARLSTQIVGLLKKCAGLLGAKKIDVLFIGLAARQPTQTITDATRRRARHLGQKLAAGQRRQKGP